MNEPLSYFVKYKNTVEKTSLDSTLLQVNNDLSTVLNILSHSDFNDNVKEELLKQKNKILKDINKFDNILNEFKKDVTEFISKEESSYLSKSYKIYEDSNIQDNPEYILDRALFHSLIYRDEIEKYFISRISKHSNWKHSGMFIRPEQGKYVNEMTASDPLYVIDEHIDLLEPTKLLWNEQYQARIRYRIIDEHREFIFKDFPKEQLGFVVAMNFFNHKPLGVIEQYMVEIYDLLKPGGIVIFTYNNCNLTLAVQNFEKSLYSYTPESRLTPMLEMVGFNIIESYNEPETNVSWLEIKKPGNLSSIRGGQCIAEIKI